MYIFFYYFTITKILENRHVRPVTKSPKLRYNNPPLNKGLAFINPVFPPTSSTYQKHLNLASV